MYYGAAGNLQSCAMAAADPDGDVCLNENGRLLVTDALDRIISFDKERGILRAEAGLTIDSLLRTVVPHGWFVPVTPGTKFVTLGGVVANDVHGKNFMKLRVVSALILARLAWRFHQAIC